MPVPLIFGTKGGPEAGWRNALLLSLPMAGIAFLIGALLDGPSGQSTPFDRAAYPLLTVGVFVLEILFWRLPAFTNQLITALVTGMSVFFLSKLIYILDFMQPGRSVQAEMTESFFWIPALYVLSFFVPSLRLARFISVTFFGSVLFISLIYMLGHMSTTTGMGVIFGLLELNLANLTLLSLTTAFVGFKERFVRGETQSETLQHLAYFDLLTDLPNRLQVDRMLSQAEEQRRSFSLLFIDMDGFKLVNDTLGHAAGDDVLIEVAGRLRALISAGETAARLSGDEFVIVLPDLPPEEAVTKARAILKHLTRPYQTSGQVFHLSASIGVSSYPLDSSDASEVLKHADSAMYHIKTGTKNGVRRFEPSLDAEIERHKVIEREFQFALDRGQLHLVFQPIYALDSGELRKVETLLRWTHPVFGTVSPAVFIPIAESSGHIISVGRWVLQEACRQARQWQNGKQASLIVTVNVSPLQFAQPGFVDMVREALYESGLPPELLELELTEGAVMRSLQAVQEVLSDLKRLGVKVAIDDFGTGYSSLSYLKDLPISCIKIDRSFVADLGMPRCAPQFALALVEAIVGIARTLDLEIVAEGIETLAQQNMLKDLGCKLGQGFLYSRPLSEVELRQLLQPHMGTSAARLQRYN
jgi:diguanylate cyclase (GGDEF)-like protein